MTLGDLELWRRVPDEPWTQPGPEDDSETIAGLGGGGLLVSEDGDGGLAEHRRREEQCGPRPGTGTPPSSTSHTSRADPRENLVTRQVDVDMNGSMSVIGQKQRFEALYDAHRLEVLAYCGRRVSAADAADACSETFLVAWRRLDDVPAPPGSLPYLYGVAARVIANQRRTLRRRARLHERLGALGVTPPAEPSLLYVQTEQDQRVVAAVSRLDAKDREILMLDAWEHLPREEIGELMGMTRAAINQRIHRSHLRLARMLGIDADAPATVEPLRAGEGGA